MQLGVSVYPDIQELDDIKNYIELAGKYNYSVLFSSMWSIDGTKEEIYDYFYELIQAAHNNNIKVDLDVNPACLQKMGASSNDLEIFHKLGVDILRMDTWYGDERDVELINNPYGILIEYNASSVGAMMETLVKNGAIIERILTCHNFYPQRYTGLKLANYVSINEGLKKYDLPVAAFIASHNENTVGVWDAKDGLPTVEMMRDLSVDQQVRMLMAIGNIDTIMFGNAFASEEELKIASQTIKQVEITEDNKVANMMIGFGINKEMFGNVKKIRVNPIVDLSEEENTILFDTWPHIDFGDSSEWIWRSRVTRFLRPNIAPRKYDNEYFEVGDVVMVNNNYQNYCGEVQVVLIPIINDGTRNLVGKLSKVEQQILSLTKDGDTIMFLKDE